MGRRDSGGRASSRPTIVAQSIEFGFENTRSTFRCSDVCYFRFSGITLNYRRGKLDKFYPRVTFDTERINYFTIPSPLVNYFQEFPISRIPFSLKQFAIIRLSPTTRKDPSGGEEDDREASLPPPLRTGLIMRLRWLINRSASASDSSRAGGIAVTFVINAPLVREISIALQGVPLKRRW